MAKKVFPLHMDASERAVIDRLAERYGVSRAEIVRRSVRHFAIAAPDALAQPAAIERTPPPAADAAGAH